MEQNVWRACSSCKKPIALGTRYYLCSVSTCSSARTNYVFCSVPCFERHLPIARHRDAAAVEHIAPKVSPPPESSAPPPAAAAEARGPNRVYASPAQNAKPAAANQAPRETLVIASRFKEYIDARSGFNTSQSVMDVLSDHLRTIAERAIDNARAEGRKTVMDRDFEFLKRG